MSEYELYEAASLAFSSMTTASMSYVTVFFAYIVAAHLAGARLPRHVALGASVVYSLFLTGPLMGTVGSYSVYLDAAREFAVRYPDSWAAGDVMDTEFAVSLVLAPLLFGWLGSLYYMHYYIRRDYQDGT